ncbi:MAG: c-type cytochrome [Elusimicrobia bacterium]|nr:c-type cytochrome [Elusimicrobiota bacterium]
MILALAHTTPARGEEPAADAPAALFISRCSACHNVGRGEASGLDLFPASQWPPADLAGAIQRMEENVGPLDADTVQTLVRFLKDGQAPSRIEAEEKRMETELQAASNPASAETGKELFFGRRTLSGGGPACAACHLAGGSGGTLGPDLSGVFKKMGQTPLISAIKNSDYKVMRGTYGSHPIKDEEALHLAAFLETAEGLTPARKWPIHGVGGAAAVAALGLAAVFYRRPHPRGKEKLHGRKK